MSGPSTPAPVPGGINVGILAGKLELWGKGSRPPTTRREFQFLAAVLRAAYPQATPAAPPEEPPA